MDFDSQSETITPTSVTYVTLGGLAGVAMPAGATTDRPITPVNGTLRYNTTTNTLEGYINSIWGTFGTGTVTSVGISAPSIFNVTGSPVTTSGNISLSLINQPANYAFMGPPSGGSSTPYFRTISLLQNDLSDVVITSPAANQVLAYNVGSSKWVNTGAVGANATGTVGVSPAGGGTVWTLISGNSYRADFVHNLGTTNVVVTLWDISNNSVVIANSLVTTDTNTVRLTVTGNTKTIKVVVVANGQSIVAGGSTPSSIIVAENGVIVSTATKLNFVGQNVNATDAGSGTTNIIFGARYSYFANSLDTPTNSDFAVNAIAAVTTDPTYNSLNVRSFSNTVEQGVGFTCSPPTGSTQVTFKFRGRSQTTPGAASVVQPRLYWRFISNNAAPSIWFGPFELNNITIPTNAYFQYTQQTVPYTASGLQADTLTQFEITRRVSGVTGTNLAANYLLAELTLEFS